MNKHQRVIFAIARYMSDLRYSRLMQARAAETLKSARRQQLGRHKKPV